LKESQVKVRDAAEFVAIERKRSAQEVAELQAEMNDWKVIAADASEECSSLRVAFDNVVKELQAELAQ
jgi:ribosome-associated translation inhibitor RaiA